MQPLLSMSYEDNLLSSLPKLSNLYRNNRENQVNRNSKTDRTCSLKYRGVPPYPFPYPRTHSPYGVPRPVPPMKRRMKQRQPFDVYEDQYDTLKKIADDERAQGLPGSMSRMVREGIDMYLKAWKKGEK
jgi:hypothetical protein